MAGGADEPIAEDLEELYEHAPCGYVSIRPDGRIFKANATVAAWLGFAPGEMVGRRLHDLLTVAGRIFYETHFAPLLRLQGVFDEVALDLVGRDGVRLPVLVNAAERRAADGSHLWTRMTLFNATERRRYERELVAARATADVARAELETLHRAAQAHLLDERATAALREEFIAVLGHDLRNPLASIDSGMDLLLRTPLDARATAVVGLVRNSVGRMAGLIENVMDFARGRLGGGLTLERDAEQPLEPVLNQVVAELRASNPDRAIEAAFDMDAPVDCDRRRIGQLASNLLGNALTHGDPAGAVRLAAGTAEGWFELSVANGGEPIPPAMLPRIFEPFSRGQVRPSRQGLGLGLYICHAVATAHGGTLSVASDAAQTRFTFRMPVAAPAPPRAGPAATPVSQA